MNTSIIITTVVLITTFIFCILYLAVQHDETKYFISVQHRQTTDLNDVILKNLTFELKEILSHLSTAHRHSSSGISMLELQAAYHKTWTLLNGAHRKQEANMLNLKPSLDVINDNELLTRSIETSNKIAKARKPKIRVCPENYLNGRKGLPYLLTGVDTVDCSNQYDVIPLEQSVTIWLNFASSEISSDGQKVLLDDLSKSNYSHLPIIITVKSDVSVQFGATISKLPKLSFIKIVSNYVGEAMRKVVESVKTPYLLVSRSLERFTQFTNIERLLRISSYLNIDFVGGSQRRFDGHWMHSCYQYKMLNYTLRMIHGYDISYNACMYCDYISSPFLTSPKTLLTILDDTQGEPLLKNTSPEQFYLDMFLQVNKRFSTMMCPDVMFHTKEIGFPGISTVRLDWKPLVSKWKLNRFIVDNTINWSFSCQESRLSCYTSAGMLNPICCTEELNDALLFAASFMEKYDVEYTIHAGSLLGAVKVSNSLSWERDHDARIRRTHFKKLHDAVKTTREFETHGYRLSWEKCADQTKCLFDYMSLHTQNWRLEFFAKWQDCNPNDIWNDYAGNITKTRVQMGNYWLIGYPNPAGAVRNNYGPTMLEHVEHYTVVSTSSDSHINYGEGRWQKCPKPGFHGCLDNFLPMGNIQFKEVWI